jgi:hypothetical protein
MQDPSNYNLRCRRCNFGENTKHLHKNLAFKKYLNQRPLTLSLKISIEEPLPIEKSEDIANPGNNFITPKIRHTQNKTQNIETIETHEQIYQRISLNNSDPSKENIFTLLYGIVDSLHKNYW